MNKLKFILKFLLLILWLPLLIWIFKKPILNFIQSHEILNSIYQYCMIEIQAKTYMGAGILIFIGNLFFIQFLPEYAIFTYFSVTTELNAVILIIVSAVTMFWAMMINYCLGFLIGRILPKKYIERGEALLNRKWSSAIVFGGYIVPLFFPNTLVAVVAGTTRFNFKLFALLCAVGCVIHFIIINLIQDLLVPYVKIFNFG